MDTYDNLQPLCFINKSFFKDIFPDCDCDCVKLLFLMSLDNLTLLEPVIFARRYANRITY